MFLPETKGLTLEEFGYANLRERGRRMLLGSLGMYRVDVRYLVERPLSERVVYEKGGGEGR